jgi:hypothetical protein
MTERQEGHWRSKQIQALRVTALLEFVYRSELQILETTPFRKLDLFPPTLLGPSDSASLLHWISGII